MKFYRIYKLHHLSLLFFFFLTLSCNISSEPSDSDNETVKVKLSKLEAYKTAFLDTKMYQKDVFKSVEKFEDYEKQYKITDKALGKIFEVVSTGKVLVENSDYIPGSELPSNDTVAEAIGQIVDNTALFGNFQLKLPDITDRIMKNHPDWLVLIKWAIGFSNSTGIFDSKTIQMIDLLCQEMNLIERKENFFNPYRKYDVKVPKEKRYPSPKEKKKTIKKGPRMTRPKHNEL